MFPHGGFNVLAKQFQEYELILSKKQKKVWLCTHLHTEKKVWNGMSNY